MAVKQVLDTNKYLSSYRVSRSAKFEPQRTNHFYVSIGQGGAGSKTYSSEEIELAVQETNLPTISVGDTTISHGNTKVHYAGQAEYTGFDRLVCNDYVTVDIEAKIYNWFMDVYNPITDQIGLASNYKRDGKLYEFLPDGSNARAWVIKGMYPSSVNFGGTMSMDGSDVKKVEVSITYDRAFRELKEAEDKWPHAVMNENNELFMNGNVYSGTNRSGQAVSGTGNATVGAGPDTL